ncbi:metallophosphoesterase family protein [Shewanella sp. 10N.286.48.A6]|uniref:metallophosphoesterase family protein n=1 Tax=Shewanella sp. 10N.286.48.A6 TaxID=1880833 RepID=UPI0013000303|nr:metallophosphoesterase [Shewanella sp. 10N.286.48.A6]
MRILHVTDLHFHKVQCEWVATQSNEADVLCITGDFLDDRLECSTTLAAQVTWLRKWLSQIPIPVFVCSGNHDNPLDDESDADHDWLNSIPNILGDNSQFKLNGVKFGCIPYQCENIERFSDCAVLLHHEPPSGLKTALQDRVDWGSEDLKSCLRLGAITPRWLLCGHVHRPLKNVSKYRSSIVSNPGSNRHLDTPNHHWINIL